MSFYVLYTTVDSKSYERIPALSNSIATIAECEAWIKSYASTKDHGTYSFQIVESCNDLQIVKDSNTGLYEIYKVVYTVICDVEKKIDLKVNIKGK